MRPADAETVRYAPRETTILEKIAPCPTCGTECYVKSEFTTQGRAGGATAEYTPLPGSTYVD